MLKRNKFLIEFNVSRILQLLRDILNKGFFHLLSANFIIGFLGFGSQLLVAKFLTPVELGQIRTMQSFIGVATILAGFGFNTAVLKLCSEFFAILCPKNKGELRVLKLCSNSSKK